MDENSKIATTASQANQGLSKLDSFLQIFCLLQGPCFFLFPGYLKDVGMIPGILLGCSTTLAYLYFMHLYFWSECQLRKYDPSTVTISIYSLVEQVFSRIGKRPRLGLYLKSYLQYEIILSWYLGMSFAFLFVCKNFKLILHNFGYDEDEKIILLYLTIPLAVVCFVPNLTILNKVFYLTSVIIGCIIVETYFYIFSHKRLALEQVHFFGSLDAIPTYVNNIAFNICLTPVIFLYKNEMRREKDFVSMCGSFNVATCTTILLALCYSISCNVVFGSNISENVVQNLPNNLMVNISNTVMTITMILSGAVYFYAIFMCLCESGLRNIFKDSEHIVFYERTVKMVVYFFIVGVTALVPSLSSFLNLISCFSFPYDAMILPCVMEIVIVWNLEESKCRKFFVVIKNGTIILIAIILGVSSLIDAIIHFL